MGSTQAKALFEVLIDWNLADKIKALCCDTTAANLGIHKGAAVILEQLLERQLLYFPCRHHIFELVLRSAFEVYIPSVGSPNVSLFKRFRDGWNNLDHAKFTTGIQDGSLKNKLIEHIDAIDLFVQDKLKDRCLRDDYQELLNLTRIVIGKVPPSEAKFRYPGAFHHARWMAKAIYALKMYLFRERINLKTAEKQGLTAMCHFIVTVYVKSWFMASSAIHASNHDLQFLKVLFEYQSVDKKISDATLGKMLNHLWYLNPQLAATSFFDDQVSVEVKKKMRIKKQQLKR
ncbi:uncharacterized protein LOC122857241 [Aphidius gifuensis]|uniref:uncharacterized protein LOC122857241 n=1 Tax=Aphidius gifuensis TaxID=684658 RepID=UPI001CDCB42A|nr:uncharacterized protein LOC122857241 [Aphidius gifuensis]